MAAASTAPKARIMAFPARSSPSRCMAKLCSLKRFPQDTDRIQATPWDESDHALTLCVRRCTQSNHSALSPSSTADTAGGGGGSLYRDLAFAKIVSIGVTGRRPPM
jgi:hypothetical protein